MWVLNPASGGLKITPALQEETRERILRHAKKIVPKKAGQVRVRFRGPFCYIDADKPDSRGPMPLCRLRYKGLSGWSLAFYTYSHEKYETCVFDSGSFFGTPEEGLEIGALYLQ
jgi:hypothetical protein